MAITPADWLCARYPGLSQSLILAICEKFPVESEADAQLRGVGLDSLPVPKDVSKLSQIGDDSFADTSDTVTPPAVDSSIVKTPVKPAVKTSAKPQVPSPEVVTTWNNLLSNGKTSSNSTPSISPVSATSSTPSKKSKGKGKGKGKDIGQFSIKSAKSSKRDPQREPPARDLNEVKNGISFEGLCENKKDTQTNTKKTPIETPYPGTDSSSSVVSTTSQRTVESLTPADSLDPSTTLSLLNAKTPAAISFLMGVPLPRVETFFERHKTFEKTIIQLVMDAAKNTYGTCAPSYYLVAQNTHDVFPTMPWYFCVRLCIFFEGDGLKAFNVADRIRGFNEWRTVMEGWFEPDVDVVGPENTSSTIDLTIDLTIDDSTSTISDTLIPTSSNVSPTTSEWTTVKSKRKAKSSEDTSTDTSSSTSFTLIGDKACSEKVRAAMALDKESKMYDDAQKHYKTEMMNTTDPRLRLQFQKEYENVKEQNEGVKSRIALLTTPRNESTWFIDLHGLYVPDAIKVAQVKISDWWAVEQKSKRSQIKPLMLCTGLGSHSPGGYSKIKAELDSWLYDNFWKYEVHRGHVEVTGRYA